MRKRLLLEVVGLWKYSPGGDGGQRYADGSLGLVG